MKTSVKFSKILAVILAAMLMLTLLTATAFADEATEAPTDVTEEVTGETTEAAGDSTEAADDESESTDAATEDDHDHEDETTEEDEHDHSINWVDIIVSASIIVIAALAFVICYFAIPKFREKVKKFFSDYKSELKKVTWSSKEDVRKNTITVIVVILVLVIVIALLDFIFLSGIEALSHLVG